MSRSLRSATSWMKKANCDSSAPAPGIMEQDISPPPQSIFSGVTEDTCVTMSSVRAIDPNVIIALKAINDILDIRDLQPIYDALEAKVKPVMEADVNTNK